MTGIEKVEKLLKIYTFRNALGEVITWTPGQKELMASIINLGVDGKKFIQVETPTQYGKSSAIAASLIMRCTKKEQWAIVAGTGEKAQIIMDYFIDYALENIVPRELLKTEIALEKLKQERSRRHLTFSSGFEIRVFSADARNKQATGNAIMGFNAPFVVLDEAALVDDNIESKIFRMIAGYTKTKHLYLKVGNPFYRNHFLKSHRDPDFHLIHINYKQGLEEGRFTYDFIEKARQKPNFGVLYEVEFPGAEAVDEKGWAPLLTEEDIKAVMIKNGSGFGFLKVGCDPAGEGTNFNTAVARYRNYAKVLWKEKILDAFSFTERLVAYVKGLIEAEQMWPMGYWIDKVGVGEALYQTAIRSLTGVYGVNVGTHPYDVDNFVNLRAEAYWRLRDDIKAKRIHLEENDDWYQLVNLRYRTRLEGKRGKIEIMSKEEMRANGWDSPDVADALMLTYTTPDPYGYGEFAEEYRSEDQARQEVMTFDKFSPINEL